MYAKANHRAAGCRPLLRLLALFVLTACTATGALAAKPPVATNEVLPTVEAILGQDFLVSIVTESYGVFNASLRMQGSMNFPDRLHGELVPHGNPLLSKGQVALPCFTRERTFTDDKYAPAKAGEAGSASSTGKAKSKNSVKASKSTGAITGAERPTLVALDVKLHHSNSPRGSVNLFCLPAELEAMVEVRERLQEGTATPTASSSFVLLGDRAGMTGSPLSDKVALARQASSAFTLAGATEEANRDGDFTLRFFNEHEFSLDVRIPVPSADGASVRMERVWIYGYTEPSAKVYARRAPERPWWYVPFMIMVGVMTTVVQMITGFADGKKKMADRQALEEQAAEKAITERKKKE